MYHSIPPLLQNQRCVSQKPWYPQRQMIRHLTPCSWKRFGRCKIPHSLSLSHCQYKRHCLSKNSRPPPPPNHTQRGGNPPRDTRFSAGLPISRSVWATNNGRSIRTSGILSRDRTRNFDECYVLELWASPSPHNPIPTNPPAYVPMTSPSSNPILSRSRQH